MYTKKEKIIIILILIVLVFIGIYYDKYADWNNICHSWLRFSKSNIIACLLKEY